MNKLEVQPIGTALSYAGRIMAQQQIGAQELEFYISRSVWYARRMVELSIVWPTKRVAA